MKVLVKYVKNMTSLRIDRASKNMAWYLLLKDIGINFL